MKINRKLMERALHAARMVLTEGNLNRPMGLYIVVVDPTDDEGGAKISSIRYAVDDSNAIALLRFEIEHIELEMAGAHPPKVREVPS